MPENFYAVHKGQRPRVYFTWSKCEDAIGPREFQSVQLFKSFLTIAEAKAKQDSGSSRWAGYLGYILAMQILKRKPMTLEEDLEADLRGLTKGTAEYRQKRMQALSKALMQLYFPINREANNEKDNQSGATTNSTLPTSGGGLSDLTDEQRLAGYQKLCRSTKHSSGNTVEECIRNLKSAPYVNIFDLIDARREGKHFRTFMTFEEF
ncbi:hypothetical protein N0V90_001442 [Kalmusia sp. IMI 367209]|nr:hypothetical protein N0V90_001442 [Kalmusia sp. IMI 367209]